MEKVSNFWLDSKNNNKWSSEKYSEEEAEKLSRSLQDCEACEDCKNCESCKNCRECWDCRYCKDCHKCQDCQNCRYCRNCEKCKNCQDCQYCENCENCRNCRNCQNCGECWNCIKCRDCWNCQNCGECRDFKENPERIVSPKQGSRSSQTTIYWLKGQNLVVCGCWKGNVIEFEKRVDDIHGDNEFGRQYQQFIIKAKKLMGE